jgi:hypothetical protein
VPDVAAPHFVSGTDRDGAARARFGAEVALLLDDYYYAVACICTLLAEVWGCGGCGGGWIGIGIWRRWRGIKGITHQLWPVSSILRHLRTRRWRHRSCQCN